MTKLKTIGERVIELLDENAVLQQIIDTAPSDMSGDNMRLRKENTELKKQVAFYLENNSDGTLKVGR